MDRMSDAAHDGYLNAPSSRTTPIVGLSFLSRVRLHEALSSKRARTDHGPVLGIGQHQARSHLGCHHGFDMFLVDFAIDGQVDERAPHPMKAPAPAPCPPLSANLIVAQRAYAEGVEVGFWAYFSVGAPLTVLTILIGLWWL
jgi:hypothetical protein